MAARQLAEKFLVPPFFPIMNGRKVEGLPEIWICSRTAPTYAGGLASYQIGLARELKAEGIVRFVAIESIQPGGHPVWEIPQPTILLGDRFAEHSRLWSRLASRPLLHPLLEHLIRCSLPEKSFWPGTPSVIHFVGTGWDYFGFALHHLAETTGALFTVWPAVHPGFWGDDTIDLRLYRKADAVFCQSQYEVRHLVAKGLPEEKAVFCPLPPMCEPDGDGAEFRRAKRLGDRPLVLFLGRRDEGKGYPALLRAWPLVLEKYPEALLLLAGSGGSEFLSLTEKLPTDSLVDLGVPDETQKASALAACDIFCLPSAAEAFGIVYAEAWSYEKPVICGPSPAAREWVEQSGGGIIVEQTPEAIADALKTLLGSPKTRAALGKAGREFQSRELTWQTTADIHRRAFRNERLMLR